MRKCIIFGCGDIGRAAYGKLKDYYEMIAWSDNNQELHGREINGIQVVNPSVIPMFSQKYELDIFVSMVQTGEVVRQLRRLGGSNIYVWKGGFFFSADGLYPLEFPALKCHKKVDDESWHVLFVSDCAGIREHKMASIVKKAGGKVFLAYIIQSPYDECSEYADMYEEIYPVMSIQALLDFVKNSEFDIIHCSNVPDYVTSVLIQSGKTVIYDCCDLRSCNTSLSPDGMTLEYLAHTGAAGVIYPTIELRDQAVRKYSLHEERTIVIGDDPFQEPAEAELLKFYEIAESNTKREFSL